MKAKLAKILGDYLETNATMVLFNDVVVEVSEKSVNYWEGKAVIAACKPDTADETLEELVEVLDEYAKSHCIIYRFLVEDSVDISATVSCIYSNYGIAMAAVIDPVYPKAVYARLETDSDNDNIVLKVRIKSI